MMLNKFFYEARPFFYASISVYALIISKPSALMVLSGIMMGFCCIVVASMRYQYRKQMVPINRIKNRIGHQNFTPKNYHGQNKYFIE